MKQLHEPVETCSACGGPAEIRKEDYVWEHSGYGASGEKCNDGLPIILVDNEMICCLSPTCGNKDPVFAWLKKLLDIAGQLPVSTTTPKLKWMAEERRWQVLKPLPVVRGTIKE